MQLQWRQLNNYVSRGEGGQLAYCVYLYLCLCLCLCLFLCLCLCVCVCVCVRPAFDVRAERCIPINSACVYLCVCLCV